MEAAELEGTNRGWPVGVLSRHMALHRLRERASEAECERRCESFEGSPLDGWLRSRSLRRRTLGGLAEPRAGERGGGHDGAGAETPPLRGARAGPDSRALLARQ